MIHITDFNGDIIDFISKSDGAVTEAEHMINVEDKLETFDFTVLTERTEHMQKRNRVIIEDKDGQYREFIIYNISSDLNGYTRVQTNASALEDIKTAKPVGPHKLDKHTVKQALEYALSDTGWEVSDEAEWGGTKTTSWTGWHDRISILKQLETTYNMRLSFHVEVGSNRIENRYVSLNKVEPMFNGEEIVYGDNMIDLKRTVDFSDIATALICLGPEDNETGKREIVEVKDDDAQAQFGLPYRYIWDIYEPQSSDENMTRQRLTTLGRTALNKRKQESISYEIDGIGLSASAGDMIRVKNEDFTPELYVDAEVVEVTTDLISGESQYKFGVIKEYTRDDVYARFNAMLSGLRERLNKVVENTDSIISERLEEELKYVERYIEKSPTPPLNPKEGQLWLDTSHDGVAVLKRYENGQWIKSSVSDVKDIGGMTREETMYEALKERLVRNEVDYSEVFKRHGALVSEKHYHYVDEDIKNDLTNRYNALQQSYDDFKQAFNNINAEQPTIGLITTAISRAVEFEANLKEYNDSYYVARKAFDEVIALLQSQYSDEKFNEAMEEVAGAIGGTFDGTNIIADIPNQEDLKALNESIKQYLNGELDTLDGKLGKQIETVVNQAKDEFSVAINSVDNKVAGLNDELDTVSQAVSKNNASISLLENEIKLKADSNTVKQMLDSELKAVKSNVQTNQSELKLLSNQISSKVEKSEYTTDINGITRDISNTKSEVNQLSESINSKITSVEQKFDDLEIGGRNLLLGTNDFSSGWNQVISENVIIKENERNWLKLDSVWNVYQTIEVIPNEIYTVSFLAKSSTEEDSVAYVPIRGDNGGTLTKIEYPTRKVTKDVERYSFTFVPKTNKIRINFLSNSRVIPNVMFSEMKLEKGNKATDWTPAPEDYQTQIDSQGNILTKHETEIEQNKLGIGTKVSYTEMNGTQKTLEKLLTEFSQTADGFNFRIDSNGMIQDLTFDRNGFKLNSNLIEFNDGDVLIKDGVTTIKDAYIDKLFSKTAFIENLKAVDIDLNRATITGGDSTNNIKLDHQSIMSYGTFTRSWAGETDTANLELGLYDGQMRMRNLDTGYRLYLTERGLSTSMAGAIDEFTSGTLEFHSQRFNKKSRGVTLHSSYGTVAMVSDYSTAVVRSNLTANIESDAYSVYIRPTRLTRSGLNEFAFYVKGNDSPQETDGTLLFGDLTGASTSGSGLRFSKRRNLNTVYVTNINGDIGTGDISVKDAEIRGSIRTIGGLDIRTWDGKGYNQLRAGALNTYNSLVFASHSGGNAYLGVGYNELRVTNNNGYNGGNTSYRPVRASAFNQGSSLFYKTNIKNIENIGLSVIRDLTVVEYDLIQDIKNGIENRKQLGFIAEYSESIATIDNKAIDVYRLSAYNTKAIQELAHENDELKSEIKELNNKLNKIMEMIK